MISSFDYYKKVESPNMYLCNPDRRPICALNAEDRHLVLRFNDLSDLTFTVPKIKGAEESYALVESKRLIFVEKIGWFQIETANETITGDTYKKEVTARSHQYALKNRGFVTEERVYMFYNPNDPLDEKYNSGNMAAMPSVVGQLYQQAGVKVSLLSADVEPTSDKIEWTIVYIDPILKFKSASYSAMYESASGYENVCRGFEANDGLNGYDFIINKVEKAFEVIFEFDFLYHTIKVKTLDAITQPTDIYLSFDNIMNTLTIKENAEDIVTVMSCNGGNLDIRTVNPMGTNYIVDFEYYKKKQSDDGTIDYPWMSKELIDALDEWKVEYDKWQDTYASLVLSLQSLYINKATLDDSIRASNLKLTDMQVARDQYINKEDEDIDGAGTITGETVIVGATSIKPQTSFYTTPFTDKSIIVGHVNMPSMTKGDDGVYTFWFADNGTRGAAETLIQNYYDEETGMDDVEVPLYFMDGDTRSYCKLNISTVVEIAKDNDGNPASFIHNTGNVWASKTAFITMADTTFVVYKTSAVDSYQLSCGSFSLRFTSNSYFVYNGVRYRVVASEDGIVSLYRYYVSGFDRFTTYKETAGVGGWCDLWESYITNKLVTELNAVSTRIDSTTQEMERISELCNIQKFIKRKSNELYNELSNYWIEGEYTNDNIATHDATTMAERIDLAKELMAAGKVDLIKSAQPKFEMSVDAINFIKMYEFRQFTNELALGKTITIEKTDGVHYRPALMSIEYDLDVADSFTMTFSNASKPGDTAMTFADLIKDSSSTSRTVSANWSNLTDYSRNKEQITRLIEYPLDRALRAMQASLASQSFIIDESGILGRKYDQEFDGANGTFSPEQIRIINNTIIFTRDNWETAATALGKTEYGYGLVAEVLVGELILGEKISIGSTSERVRIDDQGILIKNDKGDAVFEADSKGNISMVGAITATSLTISNQTAKDAGLVVPDDISDFITEESVTNMAGILRQEFIAADGVLQSTIEQTYATKESVNASVSQLLQTADAISATVSMIEDTYAPQESGNTSFSYILTSSKFTLNANGNEVFKCDKDGIYVNGTGEFTGMIHATAGGTIGAFTVTQDGLESQYITLNSKEIRFPIQSTFNLNDEVAIYTSNAAGGNTSYITTVNTSDFVIQNLTGAGIKFSKDKTTVNQTITMTFNGPNLSAAGDKGNALTLNHSIPSPDVGWGASYDFNYTATLSAALPYPCTKTAYVRYVYDFIRGGFEYRTHAITLTFPAFVTSISGSVNLKSKDETQTRYNPNDNRFETGVYFSSYGSRTNQATVTVISFSSTNNTLYSLGNFSPNENQKYSLGANNMAWGNLYLYSGTQVGSDIRLKNSVVKLSENYDTFFDELTPVSYILNNGTSKRRHVGFIAQDVEESLKKAGIDTKDFAGLCIPSEGELYYMLRYEEFIALNTAQIQRLKSKVNDLEREVALLQAAVKKDS